MLKRIVAILLCSLYLTSLSSTSNAALDERRAEISTLVADSAPKIMIVGDSISQGHEGDFTWRYRLAEHLAKVGTAVDFVGPWLGTDVLPASYPPGWPDVPIPPSRHGAYRPGITFDSDHLAQWGWQMHQAKDVIASNVGAHQPNYLIVELGFNDLAWGVNGPDGVINDLKWLINNARTANPQLRIVVANVIHRTPLPQLPQLPQLVNSYNSLLNAVVSEVSTSTSPVVVANIAQHFDATRDAYDGLHPNVRGEYVIGKVIADTMFEKFWFGNMYGEIPSSLPANLTPGTPTSATATPVDDKIRVSWSHVFGATGYKFMQRDATVGGTFKEAQLPVNADSWVADYLPAGHRMEFYVVPMRGSATGTNSPTAAATVRPLPVVTNTRLTVHRDRPYTVTVSWDPVAGADDYHVYGAPGCNEDGFPPSLDKYSLQQWGLGAKTSWTQEYVLSTCMNYIVVASRYGGESAKTWPGAQTMPYQHNYDHYLAQNRYLRTNPDPGDRRATTRVAAGSGSSRGIVVARGYIRNKDNFTSLIGDHRGFDPNPYASAKIGVAWDTATGEVGVYVHKSCVLPGSPPPWIPGCHDAHPISFVSNAGAHGDTDDSPMNYVTVSRTTSGTLIVTVSAKNSWTNFLGRINATFTVSPSTGLSYSARFNGDRFPAWEFYRYPWTAVAGGTSTNGVHATIGTKDQTEIGDLKSGARSLCDSVPPEKTTVTNPMSCSNAKTSQTSRAARRLPAN